MMRSLLLVLALAACSTDPMPVAPDAAQDVAPDASPPDAPQDAAPLPDLTALEDVASPPRDAAPDARPDARADVAADVPRDVAGEPADAAPDIADAPALDPLLERATAVRVTVRSTARDWTMPRTQVCTITGSTVSVGADFDVPFVRAFTVLGPVNGPVTLTEVSGGMGTSDVRATIRRGPNYSAAGTTRANVLVQGMIPGGLALELTALGCVVR